MFIESGVAFWAGYRLGFLLMIHDRNRYQLAAMGAAVMFGFLFHTEVPRMRRCVVELGGFGLTAE